MKLAKHVYFPVILMAVLLVGGFSYADQERKGRSYEVTITNITRGQIISPPVIISHDENFYLFRLGHPAIAELISLAEDGLTDPLTNYLDTVSAVFDYTVAPGGILPGESVTLEIAARGRFRFISAAGMLVSTNDAFFAIRNVRTLPNREVAVEAEAYDAGSEANNENCRYVPGPPCGSGGVRDTIDAEGYVHVHAGIHGIADLSPAEFDWRNPVAHITIRHFK